MIPTTIQFRGARALLGLSQEEAARAAGVGVRTLITVEQGGGSRLTKERLMGFYLGEGVSFGLSRDGKTETVSLRHP